MRGLTSVLLLASLLLVAPAQAVEAEPDCKEVQKKVAQGIILTVDSDCDAQVDARVQECVWGGYWDTTTAGPLTVRVYKCSPPTEMSTSLGPCPSEKQIGIGTLSLADDCSAQLDIKFYECIWGGHWRSVGTDQARVRVYECSTGPDPR